MQSIQASKLFQEQRLADGSRIHHDNHPLPPAITSFDHALDLSLWRNYLQPFACALVHPQSQEVILARDHLGVAPLYYCHYQGKKLFVGETIPAILAQLPSTPSLCEHEIELLFEEDKFYSDTTYYQGINRVEPGHLMHFKSDGSVAKIAFWQLEPEGPMLHYADERDYLDHFSALMNESIHNATDDQINIAAEFSAGLDSSAVYCAAAAINVKPKLYMHVAQPGTKSADIYNTDYEKAFVEHYQLNDIQRIGIDGFDPIQVLSEYAVWFAGPAPYLFYMFAERVHRAVAAGNHPILLSGFGGDQGVSGQLPLNFFMPELIHQGEYRQAWGALTNTGGMSKALNYVKYMNPGLYALGMKAHRLKLQIKNNWIPKADRKPCLVHPYRRDYYHSVRAAEWSLLQGPQSHEVRMRVEYSSIVSRKMGFEYRYPLLYPKLLEFILSIPQIQKRKDGRGRYLIRQYLSQFLPGDVFNAYRKNEGLGIVPSTFDFFQKEYRRGSYREDFKGLPYSHLIRHKYQAIEMRNFIKGHMLQKGQVTIG